MDEMGHIHLILIQHLRIGFTIDELSEVLKTTCLYLTTSSIRTIYDFTVFSAEKQREVGLTDTFCWYVAPWPSQLTRR